MPVTLVVCTNFLCLMCLWFKTADRLVPLSAKFLHTFCAGAPLTKGGALRTQDYLEEHYIPIILIHYSRSRKLPTLKLKKLLYADAQCFRQFFDIFKGYVTLPALNATYISAIKP